MSAPDYLRIRAEAGFAWEVSATYLALLDATGIPIKEFNLDPKAGIEAYRRGRRLLRDLYGPELRLPAPATPPVSYGHANALGIDLVFPEGGEVNYDRSPRTLRHLRDLLKRETDFGKAGMIPFFLDYRRRLQEAFHDEQVGFSMGHEGPITTAYVLRGEDFFTDLYDEPRRVKELLALETESIVRYVHFTARLHGEPAVRTDGGGLADDVSSMMHPRMWEEFVLPFWERYFQGITSGRRSAHVEDLRPEHLPFLERIGLSYYDPSISHKLNPRAIKDACRVPFGWRLANFHYPLMNLQEVKEFVFQAAADGATKIFTNVCAMMANDAMAEKVRAFTEACKTVERMLADGASRAELGASVSPEGRMRFWKHWPQ